MYNTFTATYQRTESGAFVAAQLEMTVAAARA